jgi:hypothetical protein
MDVRAHRRFGESGLFEPGVLTCFMYAAREGWGKGVYRLDDYESNGCRKVKIQSEYN